MECQFFDGAHVSMARSKSGCCDEVKQLLITDDFIQPIRAYRTFICQAGEENSKHLKILDRCPEVLNRPHIPGQSCHRIHWFCHAGLRSDRTGRRITTAAFCFVIKKSIEIYAGLSPRFQMVPEINAVKSGRPGMFFLFLCFSEISSNVCIYLSPFWD